MRKPFSIILAIAFLAGPFLIQTTSSCLAEDAEDPVCVYCKGTNKVEIRCPSCRGTGLGRKICPACKGRDLTRRRCSHCKGKDLTKQRCDVCKGSGKERGRECYRCSGTGKMPQCFHCSGTGKRPACDSCNGTGRTSTCLACSGTGKKVIDCKQCKLARLLAPKKPVSFFAVSLRDIVVAVAPGTTRVVNRSAQSVMVDPFEIKGRDAEGNVVFVQPMKFGSPVPSKVVQTIKNDLKSLETVQDFSVTQIDETIPMKRYQKDARELAEFLEKGAL